MSDDDVRARIRVSGRVQGVYFRQTTAREARRAGVSGWVRNLPDGSVEAVIEGTRPSVDRVLRFMSVGPARARVDEVDVTWEQPRGESGFSANG